MKNVFGHTYNTAECFRIFKILALVRLCSVPYVYMISEVEERPHGPHWVGQPHNEMYMVERVKARANKIENKKASYIPR